MAPARTVRRSRRSLGLERGRVVAGPAGGQRPDGRHGGDWCIGTVRRRFGARRTVRGRTTRTVAAAWAVERAEPIVIGRSSGADPSLADVGPVVGWVGRGRRRACRPVVGRDGRAGRRVPGGRGGPARAGRRAQVVDVVPRPALPARRGRRRRGTSTRSARRPSAPAASASRRPASSSVVVDRGRPSPRAGARAAASRSAPLGDDAARVGVEGEPAADGLGRVVLVAGAVDRRREAEAVEQLGAQLALLGVHRADEHEPGRVAVRDAVALDAVHARRRRRRAARRRGGRRAG